MSRGIELSPKHGVNATIPVCFWCGKEKNQLALLGRVRQYENKPTAYGTRSRRCVDNDMKAPMKMVLDYEPCDECEAKFKQGFLAMEVTSFPPDNRPPITSQGDTVYYPTGRHVVVNTEAARRVFPSEYVDGGKAVMDEQTFNQLFGKALEQS